MGNQSALTLKINMKGDVGRSEAPTIKTGLWILV